MQAANSKKRRGQAMIIVSILMGGLFLVGTAIAGLLMFYQLQQASDAVSSGAAVFAADAGIERSLYCYFTTITPASLCSTTFSMCATSTRLANGAYASSSLNFTCSGGVPVSFDAKSFGYAGKSERVLESKFSLR